MPKLYLKTPSNNDFIPIREKIQTACNKLGLDIFIINEQEDSFTCIHNASFVIADVTPDVETPIIAFEIGYAVRSGKSCLIIARKDSSFSNLGQKNTLLYDPQDLDSFFAKLTSTLVAFCQSQRIRYQRYLNMPTCPPEEPMPICVSQCIREENFVSLADDFIETSQYEDAMQEYSRAILYIGRKSELQPNIPIFF